MVKTQWLLRQHRTHIALEKLLKEKLASLDVRKVERAKNETIERMTLKQRQTGSNGSKTNDSSTEHIFLHLQDEEKRKHVEKETIQKSLETCEQLLSLYNLIINSLHENDSWLLIQYYEMNHTLTQISEDSDGPFYQLSKSTISRRIQKILKYADNMLEKCIYLIPDFDEYNFEKEVWFCEENDRGTDQKTVKI